MSNYTDGESVANLTALHDQGFELAIIQSIDPPRGYPPGRTEKQIVAATAAGMVVDIYIWMWFDLDVADIIRKCELVANGNITNANTVRQVWLDVEDQAAQRHDDATCKQKVQEALNVIDGYFPQQRTGIYTGRWFWADPKYMANASHWSDRKLWDANYDGVADAALNFNPYGGWTECRIKQYAGSVEVGGVSGLDVNAVSVAEASEIVGEPLPQPPTEPTDPNIDNIDDECDWGWQDKKTIVVQTAGELLTVADQIEAEAAALEEQVGELRRLAEDVRSRANTILG